MDGGGGVLGVFVGCMKGVDVLGSEVGKRETGVFFFPFYWDLSVAEPCEPTFVIKIRISFICLGGFFVLVKFSHGI